MSVQMGSANNTAAAARRALAEVIKRDALALTKMMRKRGSLEEDAAALGMSAAELEELRADGEDI